MVNSKPIAFYSENKHERKVIKKSYDTFPNIQNRIGIHQENEFYDESKEELGKRKISDETADSEIFSWMDSGEMKAESLWSRIELKRRILFSDRPDLELDTYGTQLNPFEEENCYQFNEPTLNIPEKPERKILGVEKESQRKISTENTYISEHSAKASEKTSIRDENDIEETHDIINSEKYKVPHRWFPKHKDISLLEETDKKFRELKKISQRRVAKRLSFKERRILICKLDKLWGKKDPINHVDERLSLPKQKLKIKKLDRADQMLNSAKNNLTYKEIHPICYQMFILGNDYKKMSADDLSLTLQSLKNTSHNLAFHFEYFKNLVENISWLNLEEDL